MDIISEINRVLLQPEWNKIKDGPFEYPGFPGEAPASQGAPGAAKA
jgi:hypothetical protein